MKKIGLIVIMILMYYTTIAQTSIVEIDSYRVGIPVEGDIVYSEFKEVIGSISILPLSRQLIIENDGVSVTYDILKIKKTDDCYISIIKDITEREYIFGECMDDNYSSLVTPSYIIEFHYK